MTNDVNISLVGDKELQQILKSLDYRVQQKFLKKVVRDTANKTMVKPLRQASPKRSGNLSRSMGAVMGKSKKNAVAFAGPRMGGEYKGYVANIIEFNKGNQRYPEKRGTKRPRTPLGIRVHSGIMPSRNKGYISRVINANLSKAERYLTTSIRTIMEREIKRYAKK